MGREHQPRCEQPADETQPFVILRDQRVRSRDRRVGNADVHGGEREQRVLEIVFRQDHQRPLGRQAAGQQCLSDAAGMAQRIAIRYAPPLPGSVPLGHEGPLRAGLGPFDQALGQPRRIGRELLVRAQQDRAGAAARDAHAGGCQPDFAVCWRLRHRCLLPAAGPPGFKRNRCRPAASLANFVPYRPPD